MEKILRLHTLLLLVGSLLMLVSCTQETSKEPDTSAISNDYQSYSHDGLSLQYPEQWSLAYDDTNALYSDRAVAFRIFEGSVVTIFIYYKPDKTSSDIADRYSRVIKPDSNKYVENFSRLPITIGDYKGDKLRWKDTMLVTYKTEISILQVIQSPAPVFVVFELLEEDIDKVTPHIIPVLNSITFTR